MNLHSEARTTPKIREEIKASKGKMTLKEAANHFNVSRPTIIKWQGRDSTADRSHRPHKLHTALTPVQEEIVVALRRSLLLSVDDLLVVVREFIKPDRVRSGLIRLLTRYQANRLQDLYAEQSEAVEGGKPKTFKDYEPGYLHVDIKYLPQMPHDPQKRYLLVAIDRATRWVYLEVANNKEAKTTAAFIKRLHKKCPIRIQTILTDNGKEFTDRFTAKGEREPTGNHAFDKVCAGFGIQHRLIPPRHPQTNGMVERFNGRISHVVQSTRFANADEMKTTLTQYLELYNLHVVQRNLGHLTPVKALKAWYAKKPELFNKRVYDHMGLDSYTVKRNIKRPKLLKDTPTPEPAPPTQTGKNGRNGSVLGTHEEQLPLSLNTDGNRIAERVTRTLDDKNTDDPIVRDTDKTDDMAVLYHIAKSAAVGAVLACPTCTTTFTKNTYNQCFCGKGCKDSFWNLTKPERLQSARGANIGGGLTA